MGSGSSARGRTAQEAKVSSANEVTVFHDNGLEEERKSREREDDEIRWLRTLIEKEKAEKEWLMSRYENTERDLVARNEECARLRSQLSDFKVSAPSGALEKAVSANDTKPPQSPGPSPSPISPGVSPGPNLKERRGLKLSVETNSRVSQKAVDSTSKTGAQVTPNPAERVACAGSQLAESTAAMVLQASASQKSRDSQDAAVSERTKDFLESLHEDRSGQLVEPMTAMARVGTKGSWPGGHLEPMSPLLRRRRDGPRVMAKSADRFKSSPGDLGSSLTIMTPKLFQMDDAPQTPKRVPATPATARRRQEQIWSTIVEDVEDEM